MRLLITMLTVLFCSGLHAQNSEADTIHTLETTVADSVVITTEPDSVVDVLRRYDSDRFDYTERYQYNDTVWKNFATGSKVHLQRLQGSDTLVSANRNIVKPILESLAINFGVWGWDHFVKDAGWADVNAHTIHRNIKSGWSLDHDSYSGNQFSHPFHGSMFYNAARYHGHDFYTSALYPLVGSYVWEYFCETNLPSYNDFLSTGIGGTAIGEATFRVSDIVFDNSKRGVSRVLREIVGSVLNPSRGFHRLLSGEMWRVSPVRGKRVNPEPFSLDVGMGNRYMCEMRHKGRHKNVAYVDFRLDYGEHFDGKEHHKPFDYFQFYALMNLSGDDPTFSRVDIRGRVATKQFSTSRGWNYDLGFYQVYKYIDNYGESGKSKKTMRAGDYAVLTEACSFAGGLYLEKVTPKISFSNDLMLDAVGFGGTVADYYTPRTYNYASGFSLNNHVRFCLNGRVMVGDDFYFARLYSFKGSKTGDPTDMNEYFWGDKGNNSVFMNRAYLCVNLKYNLKLNFEHQLYYRRSNYEMYPSVHAKSYEMKFGIIYSI